MFITLCFIYVQKFKQHIKCKVISKTSISYHKVDINFIPINVLTNTFL